MSGEFAGRVAAITGGGGGVGTTVTRRWLEAGASVLAVDAREESLARLREGLGGGLTERLATRATDLTTEAGAGAVVAAAEEAFGHAPDTLLHLVGGFGMGPLDGPDAPDLWDRMIAINLRSAFHTYRAVLPGMKTRGGGWIVGLASRSAVQPGAKMAAYAASKAGLIALTQSLSEEVKGAGVHANVLLASTIDTPANRQAMGDAKAETWVRPDDIADATLYLCSENARAVFGATLEIYARA